MFLLSILLAILSTPAATTSYTFGEVVITINNASWGPITSTTSSNKCNKLIARSNQIYHVSDQLIYESWAKGSLNTPLQTMNVAPGTGMRDFDVDQMESKVFISTNAGTNGATIFKLDGSHKWNSTQNFDQNYFVRAVATNGIEQLQLVENFGGSGLTHLRKVDLTGAFISEVTMDISFKRMSVTPDFQKACIWNISAAVNIFDLNTMTLLHTFMPPVPTTNWLTQKITFSQDSLMALLETGIQNPLIMINLNTFALKNVISTSSGILGAFFLNSSHQIVVIITFAEVFVVDIANGGEYQLSNIPSTQCAADQDNNLFICHNNIVSQIQIIYSPPPVDRQFYIPLELGRIQQEALQTINETLIFASNATSYLNSVASSSSISIYFLGFLNYFTLCSIYVLLNFPIPESIYHYLSLVYQQVNQSILILFGIELQELPKSDEKVTSKRGIHFGISSDLYSSQTQNIVILVGNIAFIFLLQWLLGFLKKSNYFRRLWNRQRWHMISGHVVNVLIPFTLPWTFLMLSSGVKNFNTKVNAVCYLLIYFLGLFFPIYYFFELLQERQAKLINQRNQRIKEQEKNIIRMTYKRDVSGLQQQLSASKQKEKSSESQGKSKFEYKNSSRFSSNSVKKNHSKSQKKVRQSSKSKYKNKEIKKKNKTSHETEFAPQKNEEIAPNNTPRSIKRKPKWKTFTVEVNCDENGKKPEPEKPITFGQLITCEIVEQWYLCQANFLLPSLVLLSSPIFFLVVVQLYSFLGVMIAFKKKKARVNSFILALYPFLFHTCFMIFYWCTSVNIIIVTELICLAVFLLGVIHHCLTVVYEIGAFLVKLCKKLSKKNQVKPKSKPKASKKQKILEVLRTQRKMEEQRCKKKQTPRKSPEASKDCTPRKVKIKRGGNRANQKGFQVNFNLEKDQ